MLSLTPYYNGLFYPQCSSASIQQPTLSHQLYPFQYHNQSQQFQYDYSNKLNNNNCNIPYLYNNNNVVPYLWPPYYPQNSMYWIYPPQYYGYNHNNPYWDKKLQNNNNNNKNDNSNNSKQRMLNNNNNNMMRNDHNRFMTKKNEMHSTLGVGGYKSRRYTDVSATHTVERLNNNNNYYYNNNNVDQWWKVKNNENNIYQKKIINYEGNGDSDGKTTTILQRNNCSPVNSTNSTPKLNSNRNTSNSGNLIVIHSEDDTVTRQPTSQALIQYLNATKQMLAKHNNNKNNLGVMKNEEIKLNEMVAMVHSKVPPQSAAVALVKDVIAPPSAQQSSKQTSLSKNKINTTTTQIGTQTSRQKEQAQPSPQSPPISTPEQSTTVLTKPIRAATTLAANNICKEIVKETEWLKLNKNDKVFDNRTIQKGAISEHCKEILSKFTLNEMNELIADNESNIIIDANELGKKLSTSLHFVISEMYAIDKDKNYLIMKLTPRQKHDIALLIIDEINNLHLPTTLWGPICKIVVRHLNENFKSYFENQGKNCHEGNNSSWMWMVELANNT